VTHSTTRAAGKRERLTTAAATVLHEQGVEKTTLADIARAADVPIGNVYYYFKTKDELVEAAIGTHGEAPPRAAACTARSSSRAVSVNVR
jgi:AcrR family transcriptional regulator